MRRNRDSNRDSSAQLARARVRKLVALIGVVVIGSKNPALEFYSDWVEFFVLLSPADAIRSKVSGLRAHSRRSCMHPFSVGYLI
jgi:hypothetical protein